jgi:hypothetical protein
MKELTKADKQQVVNQVVKSYRDFLKNFETNWQNYKTEADFPVLLKPFCAISMTEKLSYPDCRICPVGVKKSWHSSKFNCHFDCTKGTECKEMIRWQEYYISCHKIGEKETPLKFFAITASQLLEDYKNYFSWIKNRLKKNGYGVHR